MKLKGRPRKTPGLLANDRRVMILTMKGLPEYAEWIREVAAARGKSMTELVEDAVAAVARRAKFRPPPPRI